MTDRLALTGRLARIVVMTRSRTTFRVRLRQVIHRFRGLTREIARKWIL